VRSTLRFASVTTTESRSYGAATPDTPPTPVTRRVRTTTKNQIEKQLMNALNQTPIERPQKDLLAKPARTSIFALIFSALTFACFALSPAAEAANDSNTKLGRDALKENTTGTNVEKVNADLVVRDKEGKVNTVRYEQINGMLLNEFLKEHKAFIEEQGKVKKLEAALAGLLATVKEQAAQIEKVRAELQSRKPIQSLARNLP